MGLELPKFREPFQQKLMNGTFVGVRDERDLHELWHEMLQFFLRRGGLAMYPDPARIEEGYIWRLEAQRSSPRETSPLEQALEADAAAIEEAGSAG